MNSEYIKIRELVEVGDVFVYRGCLLTENDVYYMELRLMLQWIMMMSLMAPSALGNVWKTFKTSF